MEGRDALARHLYGVIFLCLGCKGCILFYRRLAGFMLFERVFSGLDWMALYGSARFLSQFLEAEGVIGLVVLYKVLGFGVQRATPAH